MVGTRKFFLIAACAVFLAAVTGAPARVDAQSNVQAAKRAYALGYKALEAGKYGEALAHYQRSYRLVPRPRTLFNVATCQEKLSNNADAWRSYRAFLLVAEARDATFAAQARDRITALQKLLTGTVAVVSNPAGASVRIDGRRASVGRTPLTLLLPPGKHVVRVSLSGATPVERTVEILPDETASVSVALALASGITIRAEPRDAVITRTGQDAEARGTYEARVRPGNYEFTIRRAGYVTERVRIRAVAGRTYEQSVRLRRHSGGSFVLIGVGGATVELDGTPRPGASPGAAPPPRLELAPVKAGQHALRVTRSGYVPWAGRVHLSPGERVEIDLSLARRPSKRARWLRWGGIGVGIVGFSAGAILGVQALQDVASDAPSRHDRGKTRAVIADGLFVAGIVGLVTAWRLSKRASSTAAIRRTYGGEPR